MLSAQYYHRDYPKKILLLLLTTFMFIVGFVLNITSNAALYNYNLDVVPIWQDNPALGSTAFIGFMNVISNIFNPLLCAAYILLFYLVSYRKLEILVFLIWFIFLSFCLSVIKQAIHQARPYWIAGSGIQMLQWTCYTEYGCPSGHSMMGIIIMQFVYRFYSRVNHCISKFQWAFYILIIFMEFLIMLSRVILGMHSLNQVLFGLMIGVYTFVPYYLFVEALLIKAVMLIFTHARSLSTILALVGCMCIPVLIEVLLTLLPTYDNAAYITTIESTSGCSHVKLYKSFQYKCFQDQALIMAAFGILMGLGVNHKAHRFAMLLDYSRISCKYLARFIVTIVCGLIPVAIFMNPLWQQINTDTEHKALIIWGCQNIAFFFGTFSLVVVAPLFCDYLSLQSHQIPDTYENFTRFQAYQIVKQMTGDQDVVMFGAKQAQMTSHKQIRNETSVQNKIVFTKDYKTQSAESNDDREDQVSRRMSKHTEKQL